MRETRRKKILLPAMIILLAGSAWAQSNGQGDSERIQITDAQVKAIDSIINAVHSSDVPGASVLLAQDEKILLRKGYGMTNMELRVPVDPGHVFAIASMSKYFTAIAILILQEQGKLGIKDDVRKYIPAYNTHGKTISIENLLTHTAGIPGDRESYAFNLTYKIDESRYAGLQFSEEQPLLFEPGTNFSYSNSGYKLLAFIIEKISGKSYNEFVQQQILDKLGMKQTYFGRSGVIPQKTTGYIFNPARKMHERIEEGPHTQFRAVGSGSMYSTIDDLYRWYTGLQQGKIISPVLLKKAWTSYKLYNGTDVRYGYGKAINQIGAHLLVGHGGNLHNYSSFEWQLSGDGIYFVILTNQGGPGAMMLANEVAAFITGMAQASGKHKPDSAQLIKLTGVYEIDAFGLMLYKNFSNRPTVQCQIITENGKLYAKRTGVPKTELLSINDSTWYPWIEPFSRWTFRKDGSHKIAGISTWGIFMPGPDRYAKKISADIPPQPTIVAIDGITLIKYCGIYQQQDGARQKFMIEKNKLVLTDEENLEKKELVYTGNHQFIDPLAEIAYQFIADNNGKITEVDYLDARHDRVAKRIRDNY
ncbi:MAG: beta-lactamase family protein [Chitinophagaceae bacterium]|nr:beta-lactamase family protein [Chitinophagaceae bacterium]